VACLPGTSFAGINLVGQKATVIGWGRTQYFSKGLLQIIGTSTPVVRKVEVPVVDLGNCVRRYKDRKVDDRQICAGYNVITFIFVGARGRIFSCVRPFYERAVSDLDPWRSMNRTV